MIVEQGNEISKFETSINEWKKGYENNYTFFFYHDAFFFFFQWDKEGKEKV